MAEHGVPTAVAGVRPADVQRRTLRVLFGAQLLAGAGLAAGITVGALLAEDMLGSTRWAGLPAALFTLGSAVAATAVGRLSQRAGRRWGLTVGYGVGALGAAGVVLAAATGSVPLVLLSLLLYGSGFATNLQARYAGADLAEPAARGRAVSTVLVATTVGAVAGPNLVGPTGALAAAVGIRELAGPFVLAAAAYALAAAVVVVRLRPDPLLLARQRADDAAASSAPTPSRSDPGAVRLAATAMVVTQLVMVAVMTMTPVHMRDHGHGLGAAGLVISLHIAAMYLPSPVTGALVDRVGRRPVLAAAAVTLLAAGLVAAAASPSSVVVLSIALVLLGLGWNLGLVGGTALLTDAVAVERRASTQGAVDSGVALAGAGGGISSGFLVAAAGFPALGLAGAALSLVLVAAVAVPARPADAGAPGV